MSQIYKQYTDYLDKILHQSGRVSDICEKVEKVTGVKRIYVAQGILGIVSIYMIFGYFAELICNIVGFFYPAYASIHAIESHNKDDDTKWLTYWVVFALFSVFEFFSDIIFSWFPLYWLVKVVFLIWCFLPIQNNGSAYIYTRLIRPVFLKNRSNIDNVLSSGVGTVTGLANKALDSARKQE